MILLRAIKQELVKDFMTAAQIHSDEWTEHLWV